MFGLFLTRFVLIAVPFAVYFAVRAYARRRGLTPPTAHWGVLLALGLVLVALSLMSTVIFKPDNRGQTYVPAEAQEGGRVRPGGFDPGIARPMPAPTAPNTAP